MKPFIKYCLFAIWLFTPRYLFSQNFISEDKVWRIGAKIYSEPCCGHRNDAFRFQGDSTINDTTYVKLCESTDEFLTNWQLFGLWRETPDQKVYQRNYYGDEILMYDFSLIENDTFRTANITFKVDSVLIKNWGGKLRKHWYLNPVSGDDFHRTIWIEGVGQPNGLTNNIEGTIGATPFLLCFSENGQLVYQNPQYNTCFYTSAEQINEALPKLKIYPNPAWNELFIQASQGINEDCTLQLFSLKGELLKTQCLDASTNIHRVDVSELKSGVYVLYLVSDSGKFEDKEVVIKK
jgi:hypothetical protein